MITLGDKTEEEIPRGMRAIDIPKKDIFWRSAQDFPEEKFEELCELGHC